MIKYSIKSPLYKLADIGLYVSGALTGVGLHAFVNKEKFGLEEIIGGVLIGGSSIYYRLRSNIENTRNRTLSEE